VGRRVLQIAFVSPVAGRRHRRPEGGGGGRGGSPGAGLKAAAGVSPRAAWGDDAGACEGKELCFFILFILVPFNDIENKGKRKF
jgi:hypothetical protein